MKVLRVSRDQTQEHCRQLEETVTNCQSTIQSQEVRKHHVSFWSLYSTLLYSTLPV